MGGMLAAIETGYVQREIENAAYAFQRALEQDEEIVVGLNRYVEESQDQIALHRVDPAIDAEQRRRLVALRAGRDADRVAESRRQLAAATQTEENLLPVLISCVENDVTLGEICQTLRHIWGEYRPEFRS
jgi:methylmalonyl-CoA mutase N-terminal domain/subunit